MIGDRIKKLLPFLNENFITFPLWEEGRFIPFVSFYQITDSQDRLSHLKDLIKTTLKDTGYRCDNSSENSFGKINSFFIYPNFLEKEEEDYCFAKKDWSIEEMLDLIIIIINKFNESKR